MTVRRFQIALLAIIAVLGLGLPATNAQATTTDRSRTFGAALPRLTDAKVDAAALTKCEVWAHGYKGWTWCEMVATQAPGNGEAFAVGTNFDVYHAWPGSGGWKSLGGNAWAVEGNGAWHYTYSGGGGGVATYGTDGNLWCRDHPWTRGWFRC